MLKGGNSIDPKNDLIEILTKRYGPNKTSTTHEKIIAQAIIKELTQQKPPLNYQAALQAINEVFITFVTDASFLEISNKIKKALADVDKKHNLGIIQAHDALEHEIQQRIDKQATQNRPINPTAPTAPTTQKTQINSPPPFLAPPPPMPSPIPVVTLPQAPLTRQRSTGSSPPLPTTTVNVINTPQPQPPPPPPPAPIPSSAPVPAPELNRIQRAIKRFEALAGDSSIENPTIFDVKNKSEAQIIQRQARNILNDLTTLQNQNLSSDVMEARLDAYFALVNNGRDMHPVIKLATIESDAKKVSINNVDELIESKGFSAIPTTILNDEGKPKTLYPNKIYKELLETEISYINAINKLDNIQQQIIINKLAEYARSHPESYGQYLTSDDLKQWFDDFNKIRAAQSEVLEVLKTKPPNEWGDVLNKMSDMYAQYAVVYNRLLEKQPPPGVNINPDLEMTLDQYLIMPVQRTPRYKLLSDDLLKNLPQDHPNRNGISQFNKMSIDVAKKMNSRVEVFEICRDLTALSKERQNSIKNAKNMKTDVKTKLQLEIEVIEAVAKHMKDKTDEKGFTDAVIEAYEEFNKNNKGPQFIEQFTKLGSTWRELERKHQFKFSHDDTSRALMTHVGEEIVTKRRASVSDVPPPPRETTLRERSSSAPNLSVGTVEPQTDITTAPPSPILHQAQRAHTEREVMLEQKTNKAPITIQEIHSTLQAQNVQNISKYVTAGSTFTKVAPDSTQFDTIGVGIEVPDRKTAQYYIQTKENSVNYSLNKDLSQNDKTAALAKICEAVVATLTSDHVINLEGKSNKEETHQALHNALVKKYGEDYANNPQAPKVVGVERTPSRVQAHSLNN